MNFAPIFYTLRPICIKFDTEDVHNSTLSEFYFYENRHNEVVLCSKAYLKVRRHL